MSRRLVLLGPPGSGKGTQGLVLAERLGVPEVSTGALFRDHLSRSTPLGLEARQYMSQGLLVPDHVTNGMVRARFDEADVAEGFILDGYPRNLAQVAQLDHILAEHGVAVEQAVELSIPDEAIITRLLRRAELEGREDDTEPVIRERLAVYAAQTEPIANVYQSRGILVRVDGLGAVEEVSERLRLAVGGAEA
jgi:adenylate kinase